MTTTELSEKTGVSKYIIRGAANRVQGAMYVGGQTGWIFPDDAPEKLQAVLLKRKERSEIRRKAK